MTDPLEALAARAEGDPFFLASLLAAYARSEGLNDAGLSSALGCGTGELIQVRLCRAPRTDPREFWEDVKVVAERFGMNPERLAEVVKRGRVVSRFQSGQSGTGGLLMAARDHEADPPPESSASSPQTPETP